MGRAASGAAGAGDRSSHGCCRHRLGLALARGRLGRCRRRRLGSDCRGRRLGRALGRRHRLAARWGFLLGRLPGGSLAAGRPGGGGLGRRLGRCFRRRGHRLLGAGDHQGLGGTFGTGGSLGRRLAHFRLLRSSYIPALVCAREPVPARVSGSTGQCPAPMASWRPGRAPRSAVTGPCSRVCGVWRLSRAGSPRHPRAPRIVATRGDGAAEFSRR